MFGSKSTRWNIFYCFSISDQNFRKSKLHAREGLRWDTRSSYGDRRIDKWSCFTDLGHLLVGNYSNIHLFNEFFSLRLLIVNNINGLKKVRGHRGLEQILNELVEMYWDIFPRNEAICVGIMLTRSSLLYLKLGKTWWTVEKCIVSRV